MSTAKVLRGKRIINNLSRFSNSVKFVGNPNSNYEIEYLISLHLIVQLPKCSILFMLYVLRSSILAYNLHVLIEAFELKTVFLDIYHIYDNRV